jgi:hypothetical protein
MCRIDRLLFSSLLFFGGVRPQSIWVGRLVHARTQVVSTTGSYVRPRTYEAANRNSKAFVGR